MTQRWRKGILIWIGCLLLPLWASADVGRGFLVLSFDDGYPSWIQTIAPELAKVGGKATAFVNNQRIHNRFLSFEDLRTLQDRYGWEIGTHTYHHHNAVEFVKRNGLGKWMAEEVERSVKELTDKGLKIHSFVFPFNVFDRTLAEKVKERFSAFRRWEDFPVAEGRREDGSVPGTSIDLAGYVPLPLLFQWIEFAQKQHKALFLYGHEVLPDDRFFEGKVAEVGPDHLLAEEEIVLKEQAALCLVPDKDTVKRGGTLRVNRIQGKRVEVTAADLARRVKPGSTFVLGPCYGTPLSYFREMIGFSSNRLTFLTTEEFLHSQKIPR